MEGWINQTFKTGLEGAIFRSFILRTFSGSIYIYIYIYKWIFIMIDRKIDISLNNIHIFCLRIFVYALSSYRIDFMVTGRNCFFYRCCAIEPISDRRVKSHLDRLVEVKPTYILLFSEIQSPKVHLN